MFWAMMYLIFFSGPTTPGISFVPDEALLHKAIAEQPRLEQVLAIRDEIKATEQRLTDLSKESYAELATLSQQHETETRSLSAVFVDLDRARTEIQATLINQRFRLKEHMTEKEWNTVFKNR
jgi:septal ring factor EnvC (AmiA/AmiB activator)